ncbi:Protein of unknown function [Mesobacillus persicus]|uniref:DUF3889 domain-containing protein n=1 Tax=Mesobacillus persicus TaxID=930146 RepID=A0A1H7VVA9_9BACI|nr:DUF3889 domain-containing protein [Mesobacillus persicus]SEM12745.1 Protein of unknown function [Mesobacillus persicus]
MKLLRTVPFLLLIGIFYWTIGVQAQIPPYAKWGQVAMKETKERYPNADIIDYHHIGRDTGTSTSTEKFKLWLKEDTREFGLLITITFDKQTEEIIDITSGETTRQQYNRV